MRILVTGANGFVGKNLCRALGNIKNAYDRTHPGLKIDEIYEFDKESSLKELDFYCKNADFVFHLAGVNRSADVGEFMKGNCGFTDTLLNKLRENNNVCPVMIASSVQATLIGRYDGVYGRSKKAGEELVFSYGKETGAKTLVYRFPNLFGKWGRPGYNSVVATFCHNASRGIPLSVDNPDTELELLYIDDLVAELLCALEGKEHRCNYDGTEAVFCENGQYCAAPHTHKTTLGRIKELIESFTVWQDTLVVPEMPLGSFEKKLQSTFLSYLPADKAGVKLTTHSDDRGSFTEILKTLGCGQFSVNISRPGVTKGQHWHNSKWEIFVVVSGTGLIRQRKVGEAEIIETAVDGNNLQAVRILPGYTHSIVNLSAERDLVTLMWANELFDPAAPDTFFEPV